MKISLSVVAMTTILAVCSRPAQSQRLLDPDILNLLHEELSGELAKDHVIEITRHHRIQGSRGYHEAGHYVLDQLRSFGFTEENAFIESFVSDGETRYQTWQSPSGWDISAAELRMIEPIDKRIVGYPEIAMSVITYSNPGNVRAELIDVGTGTSDEDYVGKDVRGKFVLATGYGGEVHRLAVLKYGAAAVVCYLADERASEYPDMLAYTGMWPRPEEVDKVTFGFNLTNRQGTELSTLLRRGERVVLDGTVTGIGLEPFFMDVVVATIPGTDRGAEEIVFSAHLDHPKESANDNASGSAALIDIARGLTSLIDSGRLVPPSRTIRFLWVPEWYGTMAYIDQHPEMTGPELGGSVLANLNLDMVGENLEVLHSQMRFTRTPHSIPSGLNEVVEEAAASVASMNVRTPRGSLSTFNYAIQPYGGGSDHMMFIDRKIPAMMFSHSPDYTHHTSEDTPDKVDPVELERSEIIGAGSAWFLANINEPQTVLLARRVAGRALRETLLAYAENRPSRMFGFRVDAEIDAIRSVRNFNDSELVAREVANLVEMVASVASSLSTNLASEMDGLLDDRIPVRRTRGPLAFELPESKLGADRADWYKATPEGRSLSNAVRFEAVNFVDGHRSVGEIAGRVRAEFSGTPESAVARFLEDLVSVDALSFE